MAAFYVYRCRCETEGSVVQWIKEDTDPAPTACPNSPAHTLAAAGFVIEERYTDQIPLQPDGSVRTLSNTHTYGRRYFVKGFHCEVPANADPADSGSDRRVQFKVQKNGVDVDYEMSGGYAVVDANGRWGDRLKAELVDVDNVLGYGAGVVLADHFQDFPVTPGIAIPIHYADRTATLYAGLYLRVTYIPKDADNASPVHFAGYVAGYRP